MRKFLLLTTLTFVFVACQNNRKSAYININRVYSSIDLSIHYRNKLEDQEALMQEHLREKSAELNALKNQLDKSNQAQLAMIFTKQEEVDSLQKFFTQALKDTTQQYNQIVEGKVNNLVYDFGKENNYSFIFSPANTNAFMYADSTLEITNEIIEYINLNSKEL